MRIFGAAGYKKAYVSEIAAAAGISKALVFYYFGSKKALYVYLIEYAFAILTAEMQGRQDGGADFFDRIADATKRKLSVMKQYPAVNGFLKSVYFETDTEVTPEIQKILSQGEAVRDQIALDGVDKNKFKDNIDPRLVLNILVKLSEGYANVSPSGAGADFDALMQEFEAFVGILKNNLYKEEFLL